MPATRSGRRGTRSASADAPPPPPPSSSSSSQPAAVQAAPSRSSRRLRGESAEVDDVALPLTRSRRTRSQSADGELAQPAKKRGGRAAKKSSAEAVPPAIPEAPEKEQAEEQQLYEPAEHPSETVPESVTNVETSSENAPTKPALFSLPSLPPSLPPRRRRRILSPIAEGAELDHSARAFVHMGTAARLKCVRTLQELTASEKDALILDLGGMVGDRDREIASLTRTALANEQKWRERWDGKDRSIRNLFRQPGDSAQTKKRTAPSEEDGDDAQTPRKRVNLGRSFTKKTPSKPKASTAGEKLPTAEQSETGGESSAPANASPKSMALAVVPTTDDSTTEPPAEPSAEHLAAEQTTPPSRGGIFTYIGSIGGSVKRFFTPRRPAAERQEILAAAEERRTEMAPIQAEIQKKIQQEVQQQQPGQKRKRTRIDDLDSIPQKPGTFSLNSGFFDYADSDDSEDDMAELDENGEWQPVIKHGPAYAKPSATAAGKTRARVSPAVAAAASINLYPPPSTSSARPSPAKRARISSEGVRRSSTGSKAIVVPPLYPTLPTFPGEDPHRARPYRGTALATKEDLQRLHGGNIFEENRHIKAGASPAKQPAQQIKTPEKQNSPAAVVPNSAGTFRVPDFSDSDSDTDTEDAGPADWTASPPPPPQPAHATLPVEAATPARAPNDSDALARVRSQAEKYKPKTPSGLRSTTQPLSSPASASVQASPTPLVPAVLKPAEAPLVPAAPKPAEVAPETAAAVSQTAEAEDDPYPVFEPVMEQKADWIVEMDAWANNLARQNGLGPHDGDPATDPLDVEIWYDKAAVDAAFKEAAQECVRVTQELFDDISRANP